MPSDDTTKSATDESTKPGFWGRLFKGKGKDEE
jgi:hypothetical protein